MKYIIKIKGSDNPITLPQAQGEKVKQIFFDYLDKKIPNTSIELGNWVGPVSDIRSIEKQNERVEQESQAYKTFEDYRKEHSRFVKLSVAEKVKQKTGWLKLIHFVFTKKKLEEESIELKEKIYSLAKKFYTENPNRMFIDPRVFKTVYGKNPNVEQAGFSILERQLLADIKQSMVYKN
jgi:hypothetical protein